MLSKSFLLFITFGTYILFDEQVLKLTETLELLKMDGVKSPYCRKGGAVSWQDR